jgi:two-component system chemotaxis response regulator CheB
MANPTPLNQVAGRSHAERGIIEHAHAAAGHLATPSSNDCIVAIGASTGGTIALQEILTKLPAHSPPILIVQHMGEQFMAGFARRLNALCHMEIREAQQGDRVFSGRVLLAPGGRHMRLKRMGSHYFVDVVNGPLVNQHRPSVDVLFHSVAECAGSHALGIIMTGMGDDGAAGLLRMRQAGARTVAQDEKSCVVYGMPKEAVKLGAVMKSVPRTAIGKEILAELSVAKEHIMP